MSDIDRLRLARTDGVGPVTYRKLMRRFGNPAEAIAALPGLARAGGRDAAPAIPSAGEAERELRQLAKLGGRMLFAGRPGYPPLLALLDDAPPVLAVLGRVEALTGRAVALVGSRNASANGQRMAELLGQQLAEAGLVVVSGMARGIDAAAHQGALRAGLTVACVAGGLDVPFPPEHADLQRRIAADGAVVSEMPLGTAPRSRLFIRRNRIIAGLSLGVVVVEAAMRSGALVTARDAQDAHREVFAVPGSPLDPRCQGANDLIRQGAHLVEGAADVLAHLPDHPAREGLARLPLFARKAAPEELATPDPAGPSPGPEDDGTAPDEVAAARTALLDLLSPAPAPVDDLLRRCHLSAPAVMSALLDLEIAGRVEHLPGNRVALRTDPGS